MRKLPSRDYAALTAGVVPDNIAPQEEMYPFVPGCGSTHWAGEKTKRNGFEDITFRLPSPPATN
ncbi:MAG: hypothetical protein M0R74_19380 [Dehalococcoidia bacterium]|nr:hypothetical protein [Dehalococcoidia bacterium]